MLRAIQEIKPTFVIAENVFGITNIDGGLVFQQVCLDLEAEGYEVQPFIIPACAKNAPHRRDRCWFIAQNPLFSRCVHGESNQERAEIREFGDTCSRSADRVHLSKGDATNTGNKGLQGSKFNGTLKGTKWNGYESYDTTTKLHQVSYWRNFPTQSPICGGDDGIPTKLDGITFPKWRAESIKGYGNAIVPQIALQLFEILQEIQDEFTQGN